MWGKGLYKKNNATRKLVMEININEQKINILQVRLFLGGKESDEFTLWELLQKNIKIFLQFVLCD